MLLLLLLSSRIIAIVLLLQTLPGTLQSPVAPNYSNDVLRYAKAAQIKAFLDDTTEPCSDFYEYACGNWAKLQPAATATGGSDGDAYLNELQSLYVRKCGDMLSKDNDNRLDTNVDTMLKSFYQSCRNEAAASEEDEAVEDEQKAGGGVGGDHLDAIVNIANFRGGWPRINSPSWYEDDYDWLYVVADVRRQYGINAIVGLEVIPDLEDRHMHRLMIGAPRFDLGDDKEAYLGEAYTEERTRYQNNIEAKMRRFFPEMPARWATEFAQQIVDLERRLAKGLPDNRTLTLKQVSRLRSTAALKEAYGRYVDLGRYLTLIFNQTIYMHVYETPDDYMANLVDVIQQTPKLTIANYTMWRLLEGFDFAGEINSRANGRWCVHKTMEYFAEPLERMFHRHYNNMQTINELHSVWADVKGVFRDELKLSSQLDWLSSEMRQKAMRKLDAMRMEFVRLDHGEEERTRSEAGMTMLALKRTHYYENLKNVLRWRARRDLAKLFQRPEQAPTAPTTLPQYDFTRNRVLVPAVFLQERFFWDPAYPTAIKYASLGFLLAREMLRGFDTVGRRYNADGQPSLQPSSSWWDTVSDYGLYERSKCFHEQYMNLSSMNDGRNSMDEGHNNSMDQHEGRNHSGDALMTSIADNGGLNVAYATYQRWWQFVADNERSSLLETLPPLLDNITHDQLFFVAFAQLWCAKSNNNVAADAVGRGRLVDEALRVTGTLINSDAFASAFNCDWKTRMRPEKKCVIY